MRFLYPFLAIFLATPPFTQAAQTLVPQLPAAPFSYAFTALPNHLRHQPISAQTDVPADVETINHRATLGRVLFYDKTLSRNNLVSCASCHKQAHGFDDDKRFSIGFAGKVTPRNSMGLANARFNIDGNFFWDQRSPSMVDQALVAFFDPIEMGLENGQLVARVKVRQFYAPLFENAFGSADISQHNIATALAAFVGSIISTSAPYDKARLEASGPMDDFPKFTSLQNRGKFLFFASPNLGGAGCISCHQSENFIAPHQGANNGIDSANAVEGNNEPDNGIGEISRRPRDIGKFRVPSLRNIAHRAPYMHDGRFKNLNQVIDHYSSGIKDHRNLGEALKINGKARKFNFSPDDKLALIAFLETLSDTDLMADEKFSNPFR